jgi:pyridoxine/pyridoxamine 5'-phosphate oxidase
MIRDAILQYNLNPIANASYTSREHQDRVALITDFESHLINSPIYLRPNFDPLKRAFPQDEVANAPYVRGFKVFAPVDGEILTGQIRLYALRGISP